MSGYLREVLADAPAFYYPLTNRDVAGAVALDRSGFARNGTISGALAFDLDPFTPASGFDGATLRYIDTPYTTANTAAGTLEAWVRPTNPAVRHRVEIQNLLGLGGSWDSTHVRRLKVNHGGVDYLPQYPEGVLYGPTDYEGRIHYLADPGTSSNEIGISGDTLAAMWNAQTCSQTTLTGSPYAYWYFGGATVPSACEAVGVAGGWSLAGLSIP